MRWISIIPIIFAVLPAFAISGNEVAYLGGITQTSKPGEIGVFDTAEPTALTISSPGGRLSINYNSIQKIDYKVEVAHHLGVAPAVAVSLIKRRERRHYFTFTFSDPLGVPEVAVFEVSKGLPQTLLPLLVARAPHACMTSEQRRSCAVTSSPATNLRDFRRDANLVQIR
jgi:hypothetical protein